MNIFKRQKTISRNDDIFFSYKLLGSTLSVMFLLSSYNFISISDRVFFSYYFDLLGIDTPLGQYKNTSLRIHLRQIVNY